MEIHYISPRLIAASAVPARGLTGQKQRGSLSQKVAILNRAAITIEWPDYECAQAGWEWPRAERVNNTLQRFSTKWNVRQWAENAIVRCFQVLWCGRSDLFGAQSESKHTDWHRVPNDWRLRELETITNHDFFLYCIAKHKKKFIIRLFFFKGRKVLIFSVEIINHFNNSHLRA